MTLKILKRYLFIVLFVFISLPQFAQNTNLQFDHLLTNNGLSSNIVTSIIQDPQGFMWFGTNRGLNRWDGYTFKIFTHNPKDSNTLSNNTISALLKDSRGTLWVGTFRGINKFDFQTEKFTRYNTNDEAADIMRQNYINSIIEDNVGDIWFSTGDGLCRVDVITGKIDRYFPQSENKEDFWNPNIIFSLCEIRPNEFLLGTAGGLFSFNSKSKNFIKNPFNNPILENLPPIGKLYKDSNKNIWLSAYGIIQYNLKSDKLIYHKHMSKNPNSISNSAIISIYEDNNGIMWFGSMTAGLQKFDTKTKQFTTYRTNRNEPWGLSGSNIHSIFEDSDHTLWIGTWGKGINKLSKWRTSFKHYTHNDEDKSGIGDGEIVSICEDKFGDLWTAHWGGGISRLKQSNNKWNHYNNSASSEIRLADNWIFDMYEDRSGNIWVGSVGVNHIDIKTNKVTYYSQIPNNSNSLGGPKVWRIFEDKERIMWFGVYDKGLDRFDKKLGAFQHFVNNPSDSLSLSDNQVMAIFQDSKNVLWVGTTNGLCKLVYLENGKLGFISYKNNPSDRSSISNNWIYRIFEDHNKKLWIGTKYGLNLFNREDDSFTSYTTDDGLPGNYIFTILEDEHNNLWLRTDGGVAKFNLENKKLKTYDESEGFIDYRSIEWGTKAFHKGRSGKFYYGGQNSLTVFHPDSLKENPNPPKIVLTNFRLRNKPVVIGNSSYLKKAINLTDKVELPHYENILSFEFASLDYTVPSKNLFAYKMEGIDFEWVYTDAKNRLASYTNLDPGEYLFKVKGSNNDGIWNEEGASIKLIILPPWWATWWFRTSTSLMLISLGYLIYRYRVNQLLALERMRVQIASDLHDDVGSSLTKIAIHSEIIKNTENINHISESSTKIGLMSREIISSLSDIIWSIDSRNDKVGDLIDRMRDYLEAIFPPESVSVNFQTEGINYDNTITQDLRQNIYLIFKEAINNSAKHSESSEIKVLLKNTLGKFVMEIFDNGRGVNLEKISGNHGLQNMKLRSDRIGGDLTIENNGGTKITLSVKEL